MIHICLGYDPRQPVAAAVAAHSVWTRCSDPVAITRLQLAQLPITRRGLTEFTYSRFLTPWLAGYQGWSIFLDADMLCLDNLTDLIAEAQAQPAAPVHVVQHSRRFEWASLMVFDNARCQMLSPAFVENPDHKLFDFAWAPAIGSLAPDWNHLVGYDAPNPRAKIVHFTQGIPIWPETQACEFGAQWHKEHTRLNSSVSFAALMGSSVHVEHMVGTP